MGRVVSSPSSTSSESSVNSSVAKEGNVSSVTRYEDDGDDDEEGDVCRICRNPGDSDNPLRYPCACSGTIKYVHQNCLLQWLDHSNKTSCQVCKQPFTFSSVYAVNTPARLPFWEFIVGMMINACNVVKFFIRLMRLTLLLWVWLVTFWIWRIVFVRSFGEAQRLFLGHISTMVILTDCLQGFLLSASIEVTILGATALWFFFRFPRELGRAHHGEDGDRPAVGDINVGHVGGEYAPLAFHFRVIADGDDADGAEDAPLAFHFRVNAFKVLCQIKKCTA